MIDDSCSPSRATKVADEFSVRRRGPSGPYLKTTTTARRIFDHLCKTTFATVSAQSSRSPALIREEVLPRLRYVLTNVALRLREIANLRRNCSDRCPPRACVANYFSLICARFCVQSLSITLVRFPALTGLPRQERPLRRRTCRAHQVRLTCSDELSKPLRGVEHSHHSA
jgi:hypothetical protein